MIREEVEIVEVTKRKLINPTSAKIYILIRVLSGVTRLLIKDIRITLPGIEQSGNTDKV